MYAIHAITQHSGVARFRFLDRVSLFGCKNGTIPRLLRYTLTTNDSEPFGWHVPLRRALRNESGTDLAFIVNGRPKGPPLILELTDVWGYSADGWTPAMLRLRVAFEGPTNRHKDWRDFGEDEVDGSPCHTFLAFGGTVEAGALTGRWAPANPSSTNSVFLWPKALEYFLLQLQAPSSQTM